jgi:radical SAM protein with 4Fe4S-binding SPASM domain
MRLRGLRLCVRRWWPMMLFRRAASGIGNNDPKPDLYDYTNRRGRDRVRIHLRVHPDGSGLLLINAQRAFHLNPTAAFMAWLQLEGFSQDDALHALRKRYRVGPRQALQDFCDVRAMIDQIIDPNGACPVCDLELDLLPPFSEIPSAPYRMDLAVTYRCNANCAHCYNARPRNYPEIDTQAWFSIIDRIHEIGIPHICFTGGEATLREDLPQLIHRVQSHGQIAGLLTNGRRLADMAFLDRLIDAGLDHVQITLESHIPEIHDRMVRAPGAWNDTVRGIRNAVDRDLYIMTNTTLLLDNAPRIGETIAFLSELGVPTVGCNALILSGRGKQVGTGIPENQLVPLLEEARERTQRYGQRLIWYTPTQYCHFDPIQMELGVKACTAAMYNMCVEPDGAVIPCQSFYQSLGNMLDDSWESIWEHELAVWLRERRYAPDKCQVCDVFNECGGGCPLTLLHEEQTPMPQNLEAPFVLLKNES